MLDQVHFWLDLRRVRIKGWVRRLPYLARNLIRAIRGDWLFDARHMSRRTMSRFRLFLDGKDVTSMTTQAFCSVHRGQSRLGWIKCLKLDANDRMMVDQDGELMYTERTGVVCWVYK